jgi:hypothetical protein
VKKPKARSFSVGLVTAIGSSKRRDQDNSGGPSRAAMSVTSMPGFRIRSNRQHWRREDLQENPRGEEEKEHLGLVESRRPIQNLLKKECLRMVNEWLSDRLKLGWVHPDNDRLSFASGVADRIKKQPAAGTRRSASPPTWPRASLHSRRASASLPCSRTSPTRAAGGLRRRARSRFGRLRSPSRNASYGTRCSAWIDGPFDRRSRHIGRLAHGALALWFGGCSVEKVAGIIARR